MTKKDKHEEKEEKVAKAQQEQEKQAPSVEIAEVGIQVSRSSSADSVKKALSSLAFITELKEQGDAVVASVVETRDIHKNPHLYYEISFGKSGIGVKYSITPEVNAKQRRVDVCKNLLAMLAVSGHAYGMEFGSLYTMIQKALEEASANVTQPYQQLKNKHETLHRDNAALSERFKKLKEAYDELNNSFLELEKRSDILADRVRQLEGMTDVELKEELQKWIFEHDGSIKYSDFAKTFNIPQSRVEEGINALLKEGYIIRSE